MDVEIKQMSELRLGTIHHRGPYQGVTNAFQELSTIAASAGLFSRPDAKLVGVYHDDPETKPKDQLRSDAGITISEKEALPGKLTELRLPPGRYARVTYAGPYQGLPETWARFRKEWLPKSGHRAAAGPSYEIYLNTPEQVPPSELRTELYLPI
jgi:AraC family transcriptional regulator